MEIDSEYCQYRDTVNESLQHWQELAWLNRFLLTPTPSKREDTSAIVFDLIDQRMKQTEISKDAASFSKFLNVESHRSTFRLILVEHGESWDIDREMLDVVCSKYNVDPRFVASHLGHSEIHYEENCPNDLARDIGLLNRGAKCRRYDWSLGGELANTLSFSGGSVFFFSYRTMALSLAVHRDDNQNVLGKAGILQLT